MTIYQLQSVYVSMGLIFGLITFGLTLFALRLALARRRTVLTTWLIPTIVAQVLQIAYSVWTLLFR